MDLFKILGIPECDIKILEGMYTKKKQFLSA